MRCGKCCGQIDDKQKRRVPAGQHRQIKVHGQLLDQNVMHKEHRVGYFGKLCAHRAGPRAIQQRGRQRQQDEHPCTGQCAGDLTVPRLCQHGPCQ